MKKKQVLALLWDGEIILIPLFAVGPMLCAIETVIQEDWDNKCA